MRAYAILLTSHVEEGGYIVDVPALPGCHSQGDTPEEAIANAREAIAAWIKSAEKDGEPIPEEEAHTQELVIEVTG